MMLYKSYYDSPIGELLLVERDGSLSGLWLREQKYYGFMLEENAVLATESKVLNRTARWLDCYFSGEKPAISELSLAPAGSAFRQMVWNILCDIPYGEVVTYGEIAKRVAVIRGVESMSAQAVGGAVGHNPISIIIPCHRVIGAKGSLTGYAGGIEKKKWLLAHEMAHKKPRSLR